MSETRTGVIGAGNIGRQHIELLQSEEISGAVLSATASRSEGPIAADVPHFLDAETMLASGLVDAVLIASPTMSHTEHALTAFKHGVHVLIEKPVAMSAGETQALIAARPKGVQFAVMLNQRFHPAYARLKQLLQAEVLGRLQRFSWTMTAWYRPDIYYRVSSWRGTWPGEGGGLLINQCIHNLDILQWLFGLPASLSATIGFGRYHDIEVEDDVTSVMQYDGGVNGVLIASSGEAPGFNRLDIVGDRGRICWDDKAITLTTTAESVSEHCATTREMFGMPEFTSETLEIDLMVNQHGVLIQNFVDALNRDQTLLTPAEEGLGSLQLANAMLMSAWEGSAVKLPVDTGHFDQQLKEKIASSSLRSPEDLEVDIDMSKSYR